MCKNGFFQDAVFYLARNNHEAHEGKSVNVLFLIFSLIFCFVPFESFVVHINSHLVLFI